MRLLGGGIAFSLLAVLSLAAWADDAPSADLDARAQGVRTWQADQLRSLLSHAIKKTDVVFANRMLRDLRRVDSKAEDLPALAAQLDGLAEDARKVDKGRATLEKAHAKYGKTAARKLAELAAALRDAEREDEGTAYAREAVRLDGANKAARAQLGQELVARWGWVSTDVATKLRSGLLRVGDEWLERKAAQARSRSFDTPWVVQSDHWDIRSNLELERVFELRDLLEAYYARWMSDWDGWLPMRKRSKRFQVLIFDTKASYESHLAKYDANRLQGVPGQYSPARRYSAFYDVERGVEPGQRRSSMAELMLHECTHQLMHEQFDSQFGFFEGYSSPNYWLHEGICEYYGMHTLKRGQLILDRKAIKKMVRTAHLKKNAAGLMTVADMDTIVKQQYLGSDMRARATRYAQSGFFCMFLMQEHRTAFRRLLRTVYRDENRAGLIAQLLGEDLNVTERAFRAFMRGF